MKGNFSKIVALNRRSEKLKKKNMVAVHMKGLEHPLHAYMTHFFRVNVPLTQGSSQTFQILP
jgi:hypothetical protein